MLTYELARLRAAPDKRAQSDAAPRPGIGAKIGYETRYE